MRRIYIKYLSVVSGWGILTRKLPMKQKKWQSSFLLNAQINATRNMRRACLMGKNKGTNWEWSIRSGCVAGEAARNRKISVIIQLFEMMLKEIS